MTVAVGCDHAGYQMKLLVMQYLWENNIEVSDCGCNGEVCDYADIAKRVCSRVQNGKDKFGVLICGTGIGMSMSANKCEGIRAALCSETYSAKYTRLHNDANVLCIGSRVIGTALARDILDAFFNTEFEGGRHTVRVQKMMDLERR